MNDPHIEALIELDDLFPGFLGVPPDRHRSPLGRLYRFHQRRLAEVGAAYSARTRTLVLRQIWRELETP